VQHLDQRLLPLHPPQREVPVAGGGGDLRCAVHGSTLEDVTGVSASVPTVDTMTDTTTMTDEFFDRYAAALLARDEKAVAALYAVPALILFPGQSVPVSDARQTEQFFASSWGQYEGVDEAERSVEIMAEAPGTVWADVTWTYGGRAQERFCYQLVETPDGYRIAVLTPLA
jgi:hypothetical protein